MKGKHRMSKRDYQYCTTCKVSKAFDSQGRLLEWCDCPEPRSKEQTFYKIKIASADGDYLTRIVDSRPMVDDMRKQVISAGGHITSVTEYSAQALREFII